LGCKDCCANTNIYSLTYLQAFTELPLPLVTEFKNALWSTLPEKAIDSAMKDYPLYISGTVEAATNFKVGTQIRL